MISKLANSSLGDSSGCVSEVPLSCLISISGSLRIARRGVGGVDRAALDVDLGREHAAVREIGVVRDGEQLVAGLALAVHPVPEVHRDAASRAR